MRIGLSFDQGTPKYRLYLGALLAAADVAGIEIRADWLASPEKPLQEHTLDGLDGIIFTGGSDIEPERYGFTDTEHLCKTQPGRDEPELRMMAYAIENRLPIMAICRGMQLLNVYQGGSLIPNLATAPDHRLRDEERHQVQIEPGSALHRLVGVTEGEATSAHHQGIDRLGKGLEAVAWHADRTIEAIGWSDPMRKGWLAAVQWHPERMALSEPLSGPLFEGLLQAVRARTAS